MTYNEGIANPIPSVPHPYNTPNTNGVSCWGGKKVTEFETGAIRDTSEGKEDYVETISWLAMQAYARYMTKKASVYGPGNWRKGIPEESYERSMMRHAQKYLANKYDGASLEPTEDHLCALMFNVIGLIHEREQRINKARND
jgi:hypothetical protein